MNTFIAIVITIICFTTQISGPKEFIDTNNIEHDAEQADVMVFYYWEYQYGEGTPVYVIMCPLPGNLFGRYFPLVNIICIDNETEITQGKIAHEVQHAIDWKVNRHLTHEEFEERAYRRQVSVDMGLNFTGKEVANR